MRQMILAVAVALVAAGSGWAEEVRRTISVTGEGEVASVPDMAVISLAVTQQDRRADVAMRGVSARMDRIIAVLSEAGIEPKDLQTDQMNLQPVWQQRSTQPGDRPQIVGFQATNGLNVRVRDLPSLGGLLDIVLDEGANTFNGVQFALADPKPQTDAARAAAVADALDKAAQLAAAAGVTLGPIRTIREQGGGNGPVMMEMAAARGAADIAVAPGELTVRATVGVEFDLVP